VMAKLHDPSYLDITRGFSDSTVPFIKLMGMNWVSFNMQM
jgi:hypothetical protein